MRANNLTLLTDLYELTMMQGYFKNPTNQTVIFDMFYRTNPCGGSFAITAGLEQMIEYIENLRFTEEDGLSSQPEYVSGGFSGISQHLSFYRRYLRDSGRNCCFSPGTYCKSNCPCYGSAACRNSDP